MLDFFVVWMQEYKDGRTLEASVRDFRPCSLVGLCLH